MEKLLDAISAKCMRLLEIIMVVMMTGMLILVGINVMLRIFANSGIDFAEEIPRFMFIWLIFCGSVVAMKSSTHINVNMFALMAPRPVRKVFYAITQLLVLVCGLYITYGTIKLHTIIYENSSPVLQISTLWVYGVTYIAGPGLALIALSNLIRLFLDRVGENELVGNPEEEAENAVHDVEAAVEEFAEKKGAKQ